MDGQPPNPNQQHHQVHVHQQEDNPAVEDRLIHLDHNVQQHQPEESDSEDYTTDTSTTGPRYEWDDNFPPQDQQRQRPPLLPNVGWRPAFRPAPPPRPGHRELEQIQREDDVPEELLARRDETSPEPDPVRERAGQVVDGERHGIPLAAALHHPHQENNHAIPAIAPNRQNDQRAHRDPAMANGPADTVRVHGRQAAPATPPDAIRVVGGDRADPPPNQPRPKVNADRLSNRMPEDMRVELDNIEEELKYLLLLRNRKEKQLREAEAASTANTSQASIRPPRRSRSRSRSKKRSRTRSSGTRDSSSSSSSSRTSSRSRSRSSSTSRRKKKKKKSSRSSRKSKKKSKRRGRRGSSSSGSRTSSGSRRGSRSRSRSVKQTKRVYKDVPETADLDSEDLARMGAFYPMSHTNAALRVALDDKLADQKPEALRHLTSATGGDLLEQAWKRERQLMADQMTSKMMELFDKYEEQNQSVKAAPMLKRYKPASKRASTSEVERVKKSWKIKTKIDKASTDLGAAIIDLTTNHNGLFTSDQVSAMILEQLTGELQNKVRAEFTLNPTVADALQNIYEEHCLIVTPHDLESEINSKRITYKNLESDLVDFKNKMQMLAVARQQQLTAAAKDAWLIERVKPLLPSALSDYAIRITNKDQVFNQMGVPTKQITWKIFTHKLLDYAAKLPQYIEKQRIKKTEAESVPDEAPDTNPEAGGEATVASIPKKNAGRKKGKKVEVTTPSQPAQQVCQQQVADPSMEQLNERIAEMNLRTQQVGDQLRELREEQKRLAQPPQPNSTTNTVPLTQPPSNWKGGPVPTYPSMYPSIQTTITPVNAPSVYQVQGDNNRPNNNNNNNNGNAPRFGVYGQPHLAKSASPDDRKLTAVDKNSPEHVAIVNSWNQKFPDIKNTLPLGLAHARKIMKKPLGNGDILKGQPNQPSFHKWSTTEPGKFIPTDPAYKGSTFFSNKIGREVLAAPLLEHLTTHCYRCNSSTCGADVVSCPYENCSPSWGWCPCGHGMHLHRDCKTASAALGN